MKDDFPALDLRVVETSSRDESVVMKDAARTSRDESVAMTDAARVMVSREEMRMSDESVEMKDDDAELVIMTRKMKKVRDVTQFLILLPNH